MYFNMLACQATLGQKKNPLWACIIFKQAQLEHPQ